MLNLILRLILTGLAIAMIIFVGACLFAVAGPIIIVVIALLTLMGI